MLLIGLTLILLAQALSSGYTNKNPGDSERITSLTTNRVVQILLIYSSILTIPPLLSHYKSLTLGISLYNGLLKTTMITGSFDFFIFIIALLIIQLTSIYPYKDNTGKSVKMISLKILPEGVKLGEYPLILLFNILGASLLISSNDLITMYLAIELQSYALYILATMNRDSQKATSGGLKYFLLGGLASSLILFGSGLIYAYTGLTNFQDIYLVLQLNEMSNYIGIGLVIILVGYLFKIGGAPFHNWSPDVYDGVPTIVTTWIAILPKISIFIFLLSFLIPIENYNLFKFVNWLDILLVSSTLSLIIGTVVGLAQYRIKRLLAYSSISHIGFLLLALLIHTPDSIESFLFYLFQYTISNLNIFLVIISFGYLFFLSEDSRIMIKDKYSPIQYISQLKGEFIRNPYLSLSLMITLFSFAGIPPFIGFFAKQMVLLSAVKNGYIFLAFIGVISSVISAAYYLRVIKQVSFEDPLKFLPVKNENVTINDFLSFTISILTIFIVIFIVKAEFILNSAHLLALTIYYI